MKTPHPLSRHAALILVAMRLLVVAVGVCFLSVVLLFVLQAQPPDQKTFACGVVTTAYDYTATDLDSTAQRGAKLFESNCASCHNLSSERLIGPGLAGIQERRRLDWIIAWVQNSQLLIEKGDRYGKQLFLEYDGVAMPTFQELTAQDIQAILAYAEVVSARPVLVLR